MVNEKSFYQTRTFSIIMVATIAVMAMMAIFFLTRTLSTVTPVLNVEAPSALKATHPQVVAGAVPSAESQNRTQLAKAYVALFGSTSRAQQAETARWNGLAEEFALSSGSTSRAQQAETARWNGLAEEFALSSGSTSRAQQAETARWNDLAEEFALSSSSPSPLQQAEFVGLGELRRLEAGQLFQNTGATESIRQLMGMGDLHFLEGQQ